MVIFCINGVAASALHLLSGGVVAVAFGVAYRLSADERGRDRLLLREVYEQLASLRPTWVTAETFAAEDEQSMIFLVNTDSEQRLSELEALTRYWADLDRRCVTPSWTCALRRATIDSLPVSRIAFWNCYRRTWAFPPPLPLGPRQVIDGLRFGR